MKLRPIVYAAAFATMAAGGLASSSGAEAAALLKPASSGFDREVSAAGEVEQVQYRRGPAPRFYGRPAYGPRFYGGPAPVWGYRPWYRRPYFGTIVAGVALGTIIGVTAYGLAPRPPRPDLCWYWADPSQTRGYWDYC